MSATYTLHLTDGTSLVDITSLESNGVGNISTPRRILDIDFSSTPPSFIVGDNITARMVPGFVFEVFDSAYDGVYTVAPAGSTSIDDTTTIPVVENIAVGNFTILDVNTTDDYWKVRSVGNDIGIFFPTSTVTVTGNGTGDGTYTVVSSTSSTAHIITGVTTGVGGSWVVSGVYPDLYDVGDTFIVGGAGTGDGTYTVASKTVQATTTTITVSTSIPTGAAIGGSVSMTVPYTKVYVTASSIPGGTVSGGYVNAEPPSQFALSAPPAIVLADPNTFDITWRISGDHTTRFTEGTGFNIKGNSYFDYHVFITTHVSFSAGMTHITGRINSPVTPTPDASGFLVHPIAATRTGYIQYEVAPAASSLQLMGKGAPFFNNDTTWGHALMNNAVHQLEHFADDVPPVAPLQGQIWYDMSVDQHRVLAPTNVSHAITNVNVGTKTFTVAGDFTTAVEFQSGEKIEVYNNVGLGIANHEFTVASVALNVGNTDIVVVEAIPATADVSGMLYGRYMWNGLVTATIPTTNYVDMDGHPVINVADIPAVHEYTVIVGDTPFDNDYQANVLNLRSANAIYVNVTGDTMTGDLTMATDVNVNMTDGVIVMNAASTLDFPVGSTGDINMNGANSINFPVGSTGGIYLDGNNDLIVTGTGRVDLASNEQRLNGDSFILFTDTSTGDITLAGDNDIIFPATATGDIVVNGVTDILFAGGGRIDLANNEQRMNGTSFLNFPVGSTGDVTLQGANDIVFSGTGTINMGNNKITNLADATTATDALNRQTGDLRYVNVTGDSMTGALSMTSANITMTGTSTLQFTGTGQVDMGTNKVVNLATPTTGTDATNKAYVDAYVSGIVFLTPVKDPNVYNDILSAPPLTPQPYHRTYLVKPAAYTITGRTTGASGKWIISGNHAALFGAGNTLIVNGNSDGPSNGTYTVASAANVSATTEITITGTVPATAGTNGTIYHSSGAWNGLDGRAVSWDGTAWVDILGRAVQSGDRFGIYMEPDNDEVPIDTSGMGANLITNAGKIGTIQAAVTAPGFLSLGTGGAWSFYTPVEPDAVSVTGQDSLHFGHSYTFRGTYASGTYNSAHKWIEFSGPTAIVDGAGLKFTANVLNIGAGSGIIVNNDTVAVDPAFVAANSAPDIDINLTTLNISTTATGWNNVTSHFGIPASATGQNNVSLGNAALRSLTTGTANTAVGMLTLTYNTTGEYNVAVGLQALLNNTTGNNNVAVGPYALPANVGGNNNVAVGPYALNSVTGSNNVAVGNYAGSAVLGSNNVILGGYNQYLMADSNIIVATGDGTVRFHHDGNTWASDTPISTAGLILPSTTSSIMLDTDEGTTGQVLASAGAGATPTWKTLSNSTGAPVVITPPASTVAYQNTTAYPMQILVQGGTVTLISISRDDTTYYNIGVVAGAVMLAPNDYIKLTYSAAPTMTGFPQ